MEILGNTPPDHGRAVPHAPSACEGVWRFTVPALDSAVPRARHAVRDLLARQRVPAGDELVQSLLLIVSELVTNAVRHAALLSPRITVEVRVAAGWVRIAVEDNHPYRPKALQADQGRTGGRGLLLVQALAEEAGGGYDVDHIPGGGKAVWAVLPLPPAEPALPLTRPESAPPLTPAAPLLPLSGPERMPAAEAAPPLPPSGIVPPFGPAEPPAAPAVPPAAPVTNPRRPR